MPGHRKSSSSKKRRASTSNGGRNIRTMEAKTPTQEKTRKPEQWSEFVSRKEGEREE
jgi:hypothetical protein